MASDGSYLIFASNRPAVDGGKALDAFYNGAARPGSGGNLWRVDRTPSGWSTPHRLPDVVNGNTSIFSPSIAADGSIYFMQPTGAKTRFHLFRAQYSHGTFETPVALPVAAGEDVGDFDPAVAPDESFMVFSSGRIADKGTSLFITYRENGKWGTPTYMRDSLGSNMVEARLSPDHRTLYYSSTHVLPTLWPQDRASAEKGLERMESWNNGLANIWQVSLDPWLGARPTSSSSDQKATITPTTSAAAVVTPAVIPVTAATVAETHLTSPPRIIGPGVISTQAEEFKATVSPDNRTLMYVVTDHSFRHMTLVQAERRGTDWVTPQIATFSGIWRDGDPSFAPDGTLLFISNRPLPGDSAGKLRRDFNIWSVRRTADGTWGEPTALARNINTDTSEMSPSLTSAGALYFSRGNQILRSEKQGSGFGAPVPVPIQGGDPAISADESFMVFDADGLNPGDSDLFLSCRTATGWTSPSRLAEPVSSKDEEGDPSISADGRTLYFFSRRSVAAPDRAPRARRATYTEIQREALDNIYNGSRNLYEVALPAATSSASRSGHSGPC